MVKKRGVQHIKRNKRIGTKNKQTNKSTTQIGPATTAVPYLKLPLKGCTGSSKPIPDNARK